MRDVVVSENSQGERRNRRVILKGFIPLATLAAGVQLGLVDCGSEAVRSSPEQKPAEIARGRRLDFQATAYSESGTTKSGIPTSPGVVAADPAVLPLGSVIHVDVPCYRGVYEVMDTGRLVKGHIIDIYIPDYELAMEFGRRDVKVTILRYGFNGDYLAGS